MERDEMDADDNLYRDFDLSRLAALESLPDSLPGPDREIGGEPVSATDGRVGDVAPFATDEAEAEAEVGGGGNFYRSCDLSRLVALESLLDTPTPEALPAVSASHDVAGDGGEYDDAAAVSNRAGRRSARGPDRAPGSAGTTAGVDPLISSRRPGPQPALMVTGGPNRPLAADAARSRAGGRESESARRSRRDGPGVRTEQAETTTPGSRRRLGYQPGLDGLRAISVIAVVLYHGGFGWIHGGFLGVEVFFVVSGYLITTLLIEERESNGWVNLSTFWIRRGRRLLPALFAMLLAVSAWVLAFGTRAQQADLRRNLPWSILYVANWGQIVGEVPYFSSGDPPLLRHLWSLAVEEQWYVVWPLAFIALSRLDRRVRAVTWLLVGVAVAMATMWIVQNSSVFSDPVNFNYLSTVTRSGGLLLGAVGAFMWRPWRRSTALRLGRTRFDLIFAVAAAGLLVAFVTVKLTDAWMYPWGLTLVSLLSLACVLMIVHPAARGYVRLMDAPALVAIGKRSYGLYLWHWPVFVLVGATAGSWARFVLGLAVAVPLTEVSYRYIEVPIRSQKLTSGWLRSRPAQAAAALAVAAVFVATAIAFRGVGPYDPAVGDQEVAFVLGTTVAPSVSPSIAAAVSPSVNPPVAPTVAPAGVTAPSPTPAATTAVVLTEPPTILVVGDSQGHSLLANQPDGLESLVDFADGSIDGCSVYETGTLKSAQGYELKTGGCSGWAQRWADKAQEYQPDIALVVLGAWDSLDIATADQWYAFGTPERDAIFVDGLNDGLDALAPTVGRLALLEVPCMRPIRADGAYTPPLPERADDVRTAHVNDLLRQVASSRDDTTFIEGPDEWCSDPTIADNPAYRWDGVHVYQLGAKLVFEATVPSLLDLAKTPPSSVEPTG